MNYNRRPYRAAARIRHTMTERTDSTTGRRSPPRALLAAGLLVAALAFAAVAIAAPATGAYKGTSGFEFAFSIAKGRCPAPPTPGNPNAPRGATKRGLCFHTQADPPINMTCPAPASISGEQALLDSFDGLRLTKAGTLDSEAYTYEGNTVVGTTVLSLSVKGKTASGYVHVTDQVTEGSTAVTCDSGQLAFTAKHG